MAAMPFMPLYVADYLADAAHLSTLEHGAYLLLIMTYWQRGEALPDDDKKLARIARLDARNWARVKPQICEFFTTGDNKWLHHRVERELSNVRTKSLKKREGGLARAKQMHSSCSAPAQLTDTDTEVTVAKATDAGASSDKVFWDSAVAYLGGNSKRSLIGKWCKDYGKPETASAITAAQLERPADRVSYIEGVLRRGRVAAKAEPVVGI
jgi:uncharacterized protein YdaU (DUF1376 family)